MDSGIRNNTILKNCAKEVLVSTTLWLMREEICRKALIVFELLLNEGRENYKKRRGWLNISRKSKEVTSIKNF